MNFNIRDFLEKYSCFLIFGFIIGTYQISAINTLFINFLFCITVLLIELQNENYSKITNWIFDNLYIFYISIIFGFLDTDFFDFFIIILIIIPLVSIRTNRILNYND